MPPQWYARIMNSEVGPLTPNELREMVAKGQITPLDQIRKDGSDQWVKASQLKGLFQPATTSDTPEQAKPPGNQPPEIRTDTDDSRGNAKLKQCPFCKETILAEAIKCKHCGEFLKEKPLNSTDLTSDQTLPEVGCLPALGASVACAILVLLLDLLLFSVLGGTGLLLVFVITVGTSIWVFNDAKSIGVKKGQMKGLADASPLIWLIACLEIWVVAFPVYLLARPTYKRINER